MTRSRITRLTATAALCLVLCVGIFCFVQPATAAINDTTNSLQTQIQTIRAQIASLRAQLVEAEAATEPTPTADVTASVSTLAAGESCQDTNLWNDTLGWIAGDAGPLTDFSRAGYMAGEKAIPTGGVQFNVRNYGAKGNDKHDDTSAFLKAIKAAAQNAATTKTLSVVYVPNGTYRIYAPLRIMQDNVVLRGASINDTVLKFQDSLKEYCEKTPSDQMCIDELKEGKPFSHERGFIQLGDESSSKMKSDDVKNVKVTADANRGDTTLVVKNGSRFAKGQWVLLQMDGTPDESLHEEIEGGDADGVSNSDIYDEHPRFINKVIDIQGNTITLALPLTTAVRSEWTPTLSVYDSSADNVGVENLKIYFPLSYYKKHFKELGYNAIDISSASNCWVKNVAIQNADNPIKLSRSAFCTLSTIKLNDSTKYEDDTEAAKELNDEIHSQSKDADDVPKQWLDKKVIRGPFSGHHGINVGAGHHILVTNVTFFNRFVHDVSATTYAHRNVFSNIKGFDLTLDHHRRAPNNNLYTEINAGLGTHVWSSSGVWEDKEGDDDGGFGPHSGAYNTYWNITRKNTDGTDRPVPLPVGNADMPGSVFDLVEVKHAVKQDFGLKLNFVFNTNSTKDDPVVKDNDWQVRNRSSLCTANLYKAMRTYAKAHPIPNEPPSIF